MTQPQGFIDNRFPHHVCKLHKSLYGLKQVPCAWFDLFSNYIISLGFLHSFADYSLFVCHSHGSLTIPLIYVDDLIITGTNSQYIHHLISQLSLVFEMKDLGLLRHLFWIEFTQNSTRSFLSQTKYAKDLLSKTSMLDCKRYGSHSNYKSNAHAESTSTMVDLQLYLNITRRCNT